MPFVLFCTNSPRLRKGNSINLGTIKRSNLMSSSTYYLTDFIHGSPKEFIWVSTGIAPFGVKNSDNLNGYLLMKYLNNLH